MGCGCGGVGDGVVAGLGGWMIELVCRGGEGMGDGEGRGGMGEGGWRMGDGGWGLGIGVGIRNEKAGLAMVHQLTGPLSVEPLVFRSWWCSLRFDG